MRIKDIKEAVVRSAPLYHATNLEFVKSILDSNMLRADTTHAKQYFDPRLRGTPEGSKQVAGVSLTRDKTFADDWADVILVFDQEKIKHNNKIIPINYFNDDGDSYSAQDREEREEFVIGPIKNLKNCLVGIYFPDRIANDYTNWKWVVKNIQPVQQEFEGWKVVIENPKYVGKPVSNMMQKKAVNESLINPTDGTLWKNDEYSIQSKQFDNDAAFLNLTKGNKRIGYLVVTKDDDNYLKISGINILKEYRGKGFGKILYQTLMQHLGKDVKGLKSDLQDRLNKDAIPSIYKALSGYEKDGHAYIDKKQNVNEMGRIIQGVNTPPGITIDHTKDMAKRLGFNVSRDGRPPIMPTNGKINSTPQEDPDHSVDDKKSMFGGADLTPWTNYKGRDIAK